MPLIDFLRFPHAAEAAAAAAARHFRCRHRRFTFPHDYGA